MAVPLRSVVTPAGRAALGPACPTSVRTFGRPPQSDGTAVHDRQGRARDTRGMSQGPDRVVGSVVATQAFPVKGAGAAPTGSVTLNAAGVVGDRRHAVLGEAGDVLTADTEPRLRELLAAPDADGLPLVTVPGAAVGVRGQLADEALSAFLGRP